MASVQTPAPLKPVYVHNRKYIGSKQELLGFIGGVVAARAPEARSLADLFGGSGVVAHHFAAQGLQVTAADLLYHNYLAMRCFLGGAPSPHIPRLLQELSELAPVPGYCDLEFGGSYFTHANAARIDVIRERIATWWGEGGLTEQEHACLLTSLIYAVDKVANTCGQYDAFLKHLGSAPYSAAGVHQVDAMVYRPLELGLPQGGAPHPVATVIEGDANILVHQVTADVLYLDPPYNGRQYVDNYHVLENIARWEKPVLHGKTRKFEREHLKSPYSRKRKAQESLTELILAAQCDHLLLSYNNEGIVPDHLIIQALEQRGPVEVFTHPYPSFGHGAGRSGRRPIEERLFYCRVNRSPVS
jgi:adenine-specific DNA-methyltransferase